MVKYVQDECTTTAEEFGTFLMRNNVNSQKEKKKLEGTFESSEN